MVLQNRCISCDFVIEAPDELRGQETVCPNCDATNLLRSLEDVAAAEVEDRARREAERARFLGSLDGARTRTPSPPVVRDPMQLAGDAVASRGLAIEAGRRLQDISVYLLGFAYLFLILSLVLALVLVVGTSLSLPWKGVSVLGSALVGLLAYVLFKFASDGVRALADATELLRSVEHRVAALQERGKNGAGEA